GIHREQARRLDDGAGAGILNAQLFLMLAAAVEHKAAEEPQRRLASHRDARQDRLEEARRLQLLGDARRQLFIEAEVASHRTHVEQDERIFHRVVRGFADPFAEHRLPAASAISGCWPSIRPCTRDTRTSPALPAHTPRASRSTRWRARGPLLP